MDITEFFQQSSGKWFSQRSSHHLAASTSENGRSDIVIETLPSDSPEVIKLCTQHAIDPARALFGVQSKWTGAMDASTTKQSGVALLVLVSDGEQPNAGQVLRDLGNGDRTAGSGRYFMGDDDSLTLITESETLLLEERLWFASPNLRLRTNVLKTHDGFSVATFFSEIRMGLTAKPADAA
ncbi:MAG TPA: phycobiliprotein lyase [Chroococcidiopsis sp.]